MINANVEIASYVESVLAYDNNGGLRVYWKG